MNIGGLLAKQGILIAFIVIFMIGFTIGTFLASTMSWASSAPRRSLA
jgi:hypothetical protein